MSLPKKLVLHFDGACIPKNPGGIATYGWLVVDYGNPKVIYGTGKGEACRGFHTKIMGLEKIRATNNVAEYFGLGKGLKWLIDKKWYGDLFVKGDSRLIINQVIGTWRCRKKHLIILRDRCREQLNELKVVWKENKNFEWVRREHNEDADRLTKLAYNEARNADNVTALNWKKACACGTRPTLMTSGLCGPCTIREQQ